MLQAKPKPETPLDLYKYKLDYQYYNVIINNKSNVPKDAVYREQRDSAILENMENYYMSVDRFRVNTSTIPIFFFPSDSGYSVQFYDTTTDSTEGVKSNVLYDVNTIGVEAPNISKQPIYHYSQFLLFVEAALLTSLATSTAPIDTQLRLILNPDTNKIQLVLSAPEASEDDLKSFIESHGILLSPQLYPFFESFNATQTAGGFVINMENYYFGGNGTTRTSIVTNPDNVYFIINSEYNNLPTWHTLRRIIFTTGSVPVNAEQIGAEIDNDTGKPLTQTILTDFEAPQDPDGKIDTNLYYFNENGRRINITGNGTLSKFDVRVYYQDKDLTLYPLQIAPGRSLELKIAFKRREDVTQKQY